MFKEHNMNFFLKARLMQIAIVFLFIVFFGWWLAVKFFYKFEGDDILWGNLYQLIALSGAIGGFIVSRKFFYGVKSLNLVRRSIIFFSLGLVMQSFGQIFFGFLIAFFKVNVPYPSVADIGFFGSVLCYLYALILLANVSGIKITIKSFWQRPEVVIVPIALLGISYFIFLGGYQSDWHHPMRVLLDFLYPLLEALYLSLSLVIFIFSKHLLKGMLRWPGLFIAMFVQYVADFNFLYQAKNGTWVNGGYGDLLYMCAYLVLSLSLIQLGITFQKIVDTNSSYVNSLLAEE